jgi:hypothetical protein
MESVAIMCSVARSGPKPILFLPGKAATGYGVGLPKGETEMRLENVTGAVVVARVAKIAINVVLGPDGKNCLPAILFGWFGESAGAPGAEKCRVAIRRVGTQWVMAPVRNGEQARAA